MTDTYKKYLGEAKKVHMSPKKIAKECGKDILKKSKSSKVDMADVFEYLQDLGGDWETTAEKMGDSDLKEIAREINKLYSK